MKAIITGLVLFIATAANAQKGSVSPNAAQTGIKGVVSHFTGKACDFYITAQVDGQEIKLVPMNLPTAFDVDGKKIVFDYVKTDDKISQSCGYESAVSVANVRNQKIGKN